MDIEKAMKNIEGVLNKSNEGAGNYHKRIIAIRKKARQT
jgi:hypothetical protein